MSTSTTRKGRTTRKRADKPTFIEETRRQQFLEIGVRLFRELGYEKASLARIAREAGVSKGVVLYHFSGKAELGKAVLRQVLRGYSDFLRERTDVRETAKAKILQIPSASLEYVAAHREDYAIYVDVIGCFGGLEEKREFAAWVSQRTREMLVALIRQGQEEGEIGPVNAAALADVIQGALDGLMELYAVDPESVDLETAGAVLASMIEGELSRS
ncbi:TetR/AcrR family transcriptional regulator [Parahaliea mediterranea]|uniref:TetR/AcrR family transcriptional regulator n=1 Tax=Parahaliea mediterranea TaxID=651086 RepID=A0A939DER7_9GAMM|nr:TetR/AcrR family transcriptional regulator [Parahaliea mediterranea]MBN7796851.1 TetR/AcrR family transcriptional regulator [Parahaliea mediterranea]